MSASRQYKFITENKHIIDIIQNSYEIPSQSEPFQAVIKHNRFSLKKRWYMFKLRSATFN